MDLRLNDAVVKVELSGIRQFTYLVRDTPGACALTIGEPDLNTPDAIKEAAKAALDDNDTHYPPGNGYPYLLEEISKFEAQAHGLHYAPNEIIMTVGATEALFASFSTILNAGDEVIIPTPAFGLYEALVELRQGVPVSLPTEDNHFQIDPEALRAAITPRTKAIILTSPNNPPAVCTARRRWMPSTTCSRTSPSSSSATMCTGRWSIKRATTALRSTRTCGTGSSSSTASPSPTR